LSFSNHKPQQGRQFNNADSFAIEFDAAWKSHPHSEIESLEQKLEIVLELIKDHPFCKDSPDKARDVGMFRIKLLKLD